MQGIEQTLAGHCLTRGVVEAPLGYVEREGPTGGTYAERRDRRGLAWEQRADLDGRVNRRHLPIGVNDLAGHARGQLAGANGQGCGEADVGWVLLDVLHRRHEAQADGDHGHRNGHTTDRQRCRQPPDEGRAGTEHHGGREARHQRRSCQPGQARRGDRPHPARAPAGDCRGQHHRELRAAADEDRPGRRRWRDGGQDPGWQPAQQRDRQLPGSHDPDGDPGQADGRLLGQDRAHDLHRGEAQRLQRGEILELAEHAPAGGVCDREYRGPEGDQAEQRQQQA